jgi:hypothetical protein
VVLLGLVASGCSEPGGAEPALGLTFTDVAEEAGLHFRHNLGDELPVNLLMTTGPGCAFFDYDNDGWLDVFLVNGTRIEGNPSTAPIAHEETFHALYHNERDGSFLDVSSEAGFTTASLGQGCAVGDFDGDGYRDLYVTNFGPNTLFRNRGDGTFEDVTARSGTGDPRFGTGAVFFDYDGDGDLDLYVANYVRFAPDQPPWVDLEFRGPNFYDADDDVLYRNEADGTFTDVTREAGLVAGGKGLTVTAADLDGDGDQDVFVANDRTQNWLYRNDGGGRLTEVAVAAGVGFDMTGKETAGMGIDIVDIDGDGLEDIHLTNFRHELNNLYRNLGNLSFTDDARARRLDENVYLATGWATRFADFDLDGDLDCFVANGGIWAQPEGQTNEITWEQRNSFFLGRGDGTFEEVGTALGPDFARELVSRGAAVGDYDKDGDLDLLVANSGGPVQLFRNETPPGDRWLAVCLAGRPPNTAGIGARVTLEIGDRTVLAEVRYPGTYISASDPTVHVGLLPGEERGRVEVRWPSGARSLVEVRAGETTTVEEPTR